MNAERARRPRRGGLTLWRRGEIGFVSEPLRLGNEIRTESFATLGVRALLRLHLFTADLDVEAVRVLGVEAILGVGTHGQAAALEFGFDCILVPCLDGVGDVIDARYGGGRSLAGIAR